MRIKGVKRVEDERPRAAKPCTCSKERTKLDEHIGLITTRCAACARTFERHMEHAWRLPVKGKLRWYCSYGCMRRDERPMLEEARRREERKYGGMRQKTALELAQERVKRCEERLCAAQARASDGQAWAAMTARQRKNLSGTIAHWRARLVVAEQELYDERRREAQKGT